MKYYLKWYSNIQLFSGYIFTQLPPSVINSSANWQHIVKAIGRVSMPELLVAFSEEGGGRPDQLAQMALRVEPTTVGLASLELLGNLLQFVPYQEQLATRLDTRAFSLWLEGLDDKSSTALCVPRVSRVAFWNRIILETYG